ncbi:Serine-threonine/tyrosine-protein kinase, catalytic domain [Dillenia turbinata]|uniref:Serine-threonine/tyrosine-protein kinase, catalytic domain n=1 Tax=Dillenia turbinata TaxID=194707 RepID=A0AAN8ZC54_9MAGN
MEVAATAISDKAHGVEITVKGLSKDSGQGLQEFKNEEMLMAQLQHKNLVKLLGYCIEKDEKILIYEYLPNKSLDNFIFANREKHRPLDHFLRNSKENSNATGCQESSVQSDVPFYDFTIIIAATNNFASTNKLGQGGFGSVYKGQLPSGAEIAVKRLSKDSGQGSKEFKNEVMLMTQLQHKNLVKLMGYCIEKDEKILVYEYLPNKSLDNFIFDKKRKFELNWRKRYEIIVGIAKGLVYLHQDSRLKIIHRDLKASNILLDNNLNPKISDFGIAKNCGGEHSQANTRRIVGT